MVKEQQDEIAYMKRFTTGALNDTSSKPVSSLDDQIKQAYNDAVKEGKFKNVRLKDGREIKSEDDFREYIDELNEDNDFDFAKVDVQDIRWVLVQGSRNFYNP